MKREGIGVRESRLSGAAVCRHSVTRVAAGDRNGRQEKASKTTIPIARRAALAFLALAYGGALQFLGAVSPLVLYASYASFMACVGLCVLGEQRALARVRCLCPYLLWILFYLMFGMMVAWDATAVQSEALRLFLRNCLFGIGLVLAVHDRFSLAALARLMGVAAIVNCAVCVYEARNPDTITDLALFLNPLATGLNVDRPAGLWVNPNAAAFGFLFALLASHWDSGRFSWLVRIMSLLGIYLTASRTGLYVILLCGLLYGVSRVRTMAPNPRQVVIILNGAWITGLALEVMLLVFGGDANLGESYSLQRFMDFSESSSTQSETRADIAAEALSAALREPLWGHGLFTFQAAEDTPGEAVLSVGAHNIYLAVLGEVGLIGLGSYLAVLALGIVHLFRCRVCRQDRLIITLLWVSYLIIGFTWHNQLTSISGAIYIALLYHLGGILALPRPVLLNQSLAPQSRAAPVHAIGVL